MIAIAGGTGRLGSLVVRRLAERQLDVRVIARDPARAVHPRDLPVEIVSADVRDRSGSALPCRARAPFSPPSRDSPDPAESLRNRSIATATRTSSTPRQTSAPTWS